MSLSLLDIVGPVMLGPSSSHTAGAARIGYMAGKIAGFRPERVILFFHPVLMQTYAGHYTHGALIGGLLGYREDDLRQKKALETAREQGLVYRIEPIEHETVDPNTMRLEISAGDRNVEVNGISVGGGSIRITSIDGLAVDLDGRHPVLLVRSRVPITRQVEQLLTEPALQCSEGKTGQTYLTCWVQKQPVPACVLEKIRQHEAVVEAHEVPSLSILPVQDDAALFTDFSELLRLAEEKGLPEAALAYEQRRTGQSFAQIRQVFGTFIQEMREAVEDGLRGTDTLLGGFCARDDGRKMWTACKAGRTVGGPILGPAMARALSVMETNGSRGRIVAAPTAGSAGVLPGVVLTLAEKLAKDENSVCDSLLVAAAIGLCIARKASLSGAIGGCQGEIGVAAAMTAGSAAFLGGGSPEQCIQAAALALKNVLGLVCDPPAGPVEVPCMKRNAMGVAVALMGADLALAGIKSFIPPDEVVDALVNVEKLLPQELKGSTIGGLGCTCTGHRMKTEWQKKINRME